MAEERTLTVSVRLFARARELAGAEIVTLRLPLGATVGDLRRALASARPALASLVTRSAVAVNEQFAEDGQSLPDASEIALLPPVSGG